MRKLSGFVVALAATLVVGILLAACSNKVPSAGDQDQGQAGSFDKNTTFRPVPTSTPAPAILQPIPPIPTSSTLGEGGAPAGFIEIAERKVISTASMSVQVDNVPGAVDQARATAEGLGGFVERLSSSGSEKYQSASITIRVPQDQFFTALDRLEALGKVTSQDVGSEDVTEQFIDLEARLNSALREEQSLLSLLERTQSVTEILTIERELTRVRSDIERLQGQLSFLERRVDLATISIFLFPPEVAVFQPPSASITLEVSKVADRVDEIKALVSRLKGEIDGVFISQRDGVERAEVALRVFSDDFDEALSNIEAQGEVMSKEVQEASHAPAEAKADKPDSPIFVAFIEKEEETSNAGLIAAIVAPIGGVLLAGILGLGLWQMYRFGRRQGRKQAKV